MVLKKHKCIPIVKDGWEVSDILNLCPFYFHSQLLCRVLKGLEGMSQMWLVAFVSRIQRLQVELGARAGHQGKNEQNKVAITTVGHDCRAVSLYHEMRNWFHGAWLGSVETEPR